MLLAAKGLALTAIDLLYRPDVVEAMWSEFRSSPLAGPRIGQVRS
jgi:hypothetical protein